MTLTGALVGPAVNAVGNSKYFISVILLVPLIGTAFAISLLLQGGVRFSDLALLAAMYIMTGFGLTIGFHRLLTHRSFQSCPAVKIILLILGSMGVAGPPIAWAAAHIKHHSRPDHAGDPHTPLEGIFHAHVGWLFKNRFPDAETYCPHLFADSSTVFVNRTFLLWVALSFAIPFMIGGWTGLLWGGIVRVFISHHAMFCVNSVCHAFGSREFETGDCSRNNWIIGLLALGEG
jgi:stearoyl-CoA desaturase (delta-9 desaturase)